MTAFHNIICCILAGFTGAINLSHKRIQKPNPIRHVVTLLTNMQQKIREEGVNDEATHKKFVAFCDAGTADLEKSIEEAKKEIPLLEATIKETEAESEQLDADVKQHKKDIAEAKAAVKQASAIREKDNTVFKKESTDAKTNIKAMKKAIAALKKGMGEFLQLPESAIVKHLVMELDSLSSTDRDVMTSFFEQGEAYDPQSGDIVGILQTMLEQMEKELTASTASEAEALASFNNMVAAKEKEIAAADETVKKKLKRQSEVRVKIESVKEDLEDTKASQEEDTKFIANFDTNCDEKKKLYEAVKKTRAEELLALSETIKILNDDDALELFKKTLPKPSLVQVQVTSRQMKQQALKTLNQLMKSPFSKDMRLDLIALALHGQKVSFDKVTTMIDDLMKLLAAEQTDDDKKKSYCIAKLDQNEEALKANERAISDLEKDIAEKKSNVGTLSKELGQLEGGIKALDKQVADGTETRKEEHTAYESELSAKKAAKDLLVFARERLNKFYNPDLYVPPPKKELSPEEQITANMGGTVAPSAGLVQAMLLQVHSGAHLQSPPPAAVEAYKTKGSESAGVIQLLNMLINDLDKEMNQLEIDEKDSQSDYEKFIADSADKRAADGKTMEQKERQRADMESDKVKVESKDKAKMKEAYATTEIIADLHKDCDWLLSNYDARKEARSGEIDSLKKAKAVLSGAAYSLVQTRSARTSLQHFSNSAVRS